MVANNREALWFPKHEDACSRAIDLEVILICVWSTMNIESTVCSNKILLRSFMPKDPAEHKIGQTLDGIWEYLHICVHRG